MGTHKETHFRLWANALGLSIVEAGEKLGVGKRQASARARGEQDLSLAERYAMAAIRAGLPPWQPETDRYIASVGVVRETVDEAIGSSKVVRDAGE